MGFFSGNSPFFVLRFLGFFFSNYDVGSVLSNHRMIFTNSSGNFFLLLLWYLISLGFGQKELKTYNRAAPELSSLFINASAYF